MTTECYEASFLLFQMPGGDTINCQMPGSQDSSCITYSGGGRVDANGWN